jgi:hypothetical protein
MEQLILLVNTLVDVIVGRFPCGAETLVTDAFLTLFGSGLTLAFALGFASRDPIPEGIYANIRRWRGGISDRMANIGNLLAAIEAHQPAWTIPAELLETLAANYNRLQTLVSRCRTSASSTDDRADRNLLLASTVNLCRRQIKIWAHAACAEGLLSAADVRSLGFLMPGDVGGHRQRAEPTRAVAEVKVKIISSSTILVVIDQSSGESAVRLAHNWPHGVRNALIVITADDGVTEIHRQLTTRIRTLVRMPDGSHGKQFLIKAAFLRHVDDVPNFGNQPTFSIPLMTEDLIIAHTRHE